MSQADFSSTSMVWVALIGALATIVTGFLAYFGGKNSASAQLQDALNKGFQAINDARKAENAELRGRIAALEQHVFSLENILRDNGHPIPSRPRPAIVFSPFPESQEA